jgi:hypothetical protein
MNVLILGEYSGRIRDAFIKQGHSAISLCDEPSDAGEPHIIGDFYTAIQLNVWDLIIAHPTCTCLCCSGNSTYGENGPKHRMRIEAIKWTEKLWFDLISVCDKVCIENPQGVLSTQSVMGKATQYIQPYEFGDRSRKKTGLWLYGLPKLKPTNIVDPIIVYNKDGSSFSEDYQRCKTTLRGKKRSVTYQGIANAMAAQWGDLQ